MQQNQEMCVNIVGDPETHAKVTPMNGRLATAMREALRLIRTGDLASATAAIRDNLSQAAESESHTSADPAACAPLEHNYQPLKEGYARGDSNSARVSTSARSRTGSATGKF